MNLLLHICCACCLCAPLNELRKEGFRVTGFFYNPNIHPFLEFRRRLKALRVFQESDPIPVVYQNHEQLKMISENLSRGYEINFVYRDYRYLSECSHDIARKKMIYRQGYCGCVFSEYERYKDTTRELYKGNSPYNKETPRKILGTEMELQRCDCFG